jgi:hypothetical protein
MKFMSTNVMPSWVKFLMLVSLAIICWCWFKPAETNRDNPATQVSYSFGRGSGLRAQAGANIRQFATNPLVPAPLPDGGTVILRAPGINYYRDQPGN